MPCWTSGTWTGDGIGSPGGGGVQVVTTVCPVRAASWAVIASAPRISATAITSGEKRRAFAADRSYRHLRFSVQKGACMLATILFCTLPAASSLNKSNSLVSSMCRYACFYPLHSAGSDVRCFSASSFTGKSNRNAVNNTEYEEIKHFG